MKNPHYQTIWEICTSCRTVPSAIWSIFYEFLIFWNNSKIWGKSKIFSNIAPSQHVLQKVHFLQVKKIIQGIRNTDWQSLVIRHKVFCSILNTILWLHSWPFRSSHERCSVKKGVEFNMVYILRVSYILK